MRHRYRPAAEIETMRLGPAARTPQDSTSVAILAFTEDRGRVFAQSLHSCRFAGKQTRSNGAPHHRPSNPKHASRPQVASSDQALWLAFQKAPGDSSGGLTHCARIVPARECCQARGMLVQTDLR